MRIRAFSGRTCPIATGWSRRYCRWKRWSLPNYGKTQKQFSFLQDKEASSVERKSDSEEESLIVDDVQEVCFCFSSSVFGHWRWIWKITSWTMCRRLKLIFPLFLFPQKYKTWLVVVEKLHKGRQLVRKFCPAFADLEFFRLFDSYVSRALRTIIPVLGSRRTREMNKARSLRKHIIFSTWQTPKSSIM